MVETKKVVVSNMLLREISSVLERVQNLISSSFLKPNEGELRSIAVKPLAGLLKATIDGVPFGIISVTKGWVTKIEIWISNGESKESWEKAIKLAAQQIFFDPAVGKIDWKITLSNKDMIEAANACGFTEQGKLTGEGLSGEPLILMSLSRKESVSGSDLTIAAEVAQKDKVIKGLGSALEAGKKELDAKNELIENLRQEKAELQKELDKQRAKLIDTEDTRDFKETEIISALKQRVNELEAANREFENKLNEQTNLLEEKTQRIAEQAKMILGLQNADLKKELPGSNREEKEENPVKTEPEFETSAPEMPANELENLISKIGFSRVLREIVKAIILNPGIGYAELAKKAESAKNYVTLKVGPLAKEGLIVKRHEKPLNRHIANLYAAKGVIQKLQEMAQNRKNLSDLPIKQPRQESKYKELGLNDFDITVLKLLVATEPNRAMAQPEIISKICEQQPETTKYKTQPKVSLSIRKLADLDLVSKEKSGITCLVKPRMEKIQKLPQGLQKELGIREKELQESITETPVVKSEEPAAEIKEPETTEKLEEKPEESLPVTRKETTDLLTPFRTVVAILKEHAKNNGGGIEINELWSIAIEKGLSKDQVASSIKALKKGCILTAWGENSFHQINREELAKIN